MLESFRTKNIFLSSVRIRVTKSKAKNSMAKHRPRGDPTTHNPSHVCFCVFLLFPNFNNEAHVPVTLAHYPFVM